jgi:hypothetical protein
LYALCNVVLQCKSKAKYESHITSPVLQSIGGGFPEIEQGNIKIGMVPYQNGERRG